MVRTFLKSRLGPLLWIANIQYYVVQVLVAMAWAHPYSLSSNTISDLGNTHCGYYGNKIVCSPLHSTMDLSFVLLGLTIIGGSILISSSLTRPSVTSRLGFLCLGLAGVGSVLVGLFPENTVSWLHILGAGLSFVFGNLGMLVIAWSLATQLPRWLRIITLLSGAVGLAALGLLLQKNYLGLGIGGMERLTAYPQSLWMIVYGLRLLRKQLPLTIRNHHN